MARGSWGIAPRSGAVLYMVVHVKSYSDYGWGEGGELGEIKEEN